MTDLTKWMLVALVFSAMPSCDEHEHEAHEQHEQDEHKETEGEAHAHAEGASTLHVKSSMLRDLHLTTQPAEARVAGDVVTVLGELRVNEERYAEVSTPLAARVVRVLAAPGDKVKVGQPLVELESMDVGKARAALTSAQARASLARSTLERKRALVAEQIAAPRDVQAAEAEQVQAEAELRATEQTLAALGSVRGSGARFVLNAPLDGTLLERNVLPGRRVDDTRSLFTVVDVSTLWLVVHASERDALRVKEGAMVQVSFAALPGKSFEGRVARIGTQVDPVSRTVDVRVDVGNSDGLLRPGMSATARIALGDTNAKVVAVPTQAVQRVADNWVVFIPEKEAGGFEIRKVGRGRDLDGEVEILSDLRAGETVVVDGAFLLKAQVDKTRGGGEEHHH